MPRTHATAGILAFGDEIVRGEKTDTNSAWLSRALIDRGIEVLEHASAPDDDRAQARIIRDFANRYDLVISTGGLGPTLDDLTRAAAALATDDELIEDADALAEIKAWYQRVNRDMPKANVVQAQRPSRWTWLSNAHGTAPGLALRTEPGSPTDADIYCLPGPPREMIPMFEAFVVPHLHPPQGHAVATRLLHTFGRGESDVAGDIADLMARERNPVVGTTASGGIITCRIRFKGDLSKADAELDAVEQELRNRLGDIVFGAGADTLESAVLDLLRERGETIAVVESCTGGGLGRQLTTIAGASDVFPGGWITYANEMKQSQVGVPEEILETDGAVSRACAKAMAVGGLERSGATHCLAITGIAGPGGGSDDKPVGTVWIALASSTDSNPRVIAKRFLFPKGRDDIRRWSITSATGLLLRALKKQEGRMLREVE